mmetsp:Transcript_30612/g.70637  ORF Transcript_30612/g.70637 Transcript_30612/m.70637 type:complete len:500 (+) Transcript_30612:35-1534(+)
MDSASTRLGELEKSYSELALSLHRPTNVRYTVLWDLGTVLHRLYTCFPQGHKTPASFILQSIRSLFQKEQPKPCSETMRQELCHLRRQANRQRWVCWESDAKGLEVEVAMLSGRSWKFIIGNKAKGIEVKERLAELSGIHQTELSLVCSGQQVKDDEVLLSAFAKELAAPPPQLQLLRVFRPFALTCSTDCTLKLWDMEHASCVQTLRGHGDGVIAVTADWKSRYAVSGAHDCTLRVWDLDHGICVQAFQVDDHPAFCLDFDHTHRRILTGSWDKNMKIWDSELGACLATFKGHQGMLKAVRLNWLRRRAISASCDGTLKLWNLEGEAGCLCTFDGHQDEVWCADVDWLRQQLVSGSADFTVRYWNLETGDCLATLRGHTHAVSAVSILCEQGQVLSSSWDRSIRLWDLQSHECLVTLMHGSSVTTMSVDWSHGKVLSGSPQAMKLWDLHRRVCEHDLAGHLCDSSEATGATSVSVGHNECVTSLVMNSPDYFYPEADQ